MSLRDIWLTRSNLDGDKSATDTDQVAGHLWKESLDQHFQLPFNSSMIIRRLMNFR